MPWSIKFDWNQENIEHIARHGVQPNEAEEVLNGETMDIAYQNFHSEERFREIGVTAAGRFLEIVTTWRDDRIRVVSAFDAADRMIKEYLRGR